MNLKSWFYKKRLKDKRFEFIFENEKVDEYVAIDTETTGLDPKKDEILSIGAILIKENKILVGNSLHIKIKPKKSVTKSSIKIHKIRECDLSEAMEAKDGIEELLYFIKNRPLVGYYLDFDIKILNRYINNFFGFKLPNKKIEVSGLYYDYKQKFIPPGYIDLKFDTILKDLNLPKLKTHNAFYDALMSAMIFLKLKNKA